MDSGRGDLVDPNIASVAPAQLLTTGAIPDKCATLSHMKIGVRELRNQTSRVIDAGRSGERVVLTVHGQAVADIVPHGHRTRWLPGDHLRRELTERAADPALRDDLDSLAGQT